MWFIYKLFTAYKVYIANIPGQKLTWRFLTNFTEFIYKIFLSIYIVVRLFLVQILFWYCKLLESR